MATLHIVIGGVAVAGPDAVSGFQVRIDDLGIDEYVNGTANRATLLMFDAGVESGDEVLIGLDGVADADLIFAGIVGSVSQRHPTDTLGLLLYDVECLSYQFLLNRRKVTAKFTADSATTIAEALIADYTDGFTDSGVEAGLPTLDEITFTNEDVSTCLDRLAARIGGYWSLGYDRDIAFGLDILTGGVTDITDADTATASNLQVRRDLSQVRTRIRCEGGGSAAGAEVAVGDTVIPVLDAVWYDAAGGEAAIGQQRVTYTSKVEGLGGAQVGTAITPGVAPSVVGAAGSGVTAGTHTYKYTFVTASGETLPSSASGVVTAGDQISTPSAPSAVKALGGNLSSGNYQWKVTYYDSAGGETDPSSASGTVTMDDVSAPTVAATGPITSAAGTAMDASSQYYYKMTFRNGSFETLPTAGVSGVTDVSPNQDLAINKSTVSSPPSGFSRQYYRSVGFPLPTGGGSGGPWYRMQGASDGMSSTNSTHYFDHESDASLSGTTAPTSSTAIYRRADVSIPVSADPATVGRKLYRTLTGGSTFKLVATIANNVDTTYDDNIADGSLGANAPSSNTATKGQVAVSGIAAGPSGTTSRKVYRTVAGNTGNYKLLTTIGNNSTTTYADSTADGSLGADAPSSDTSALVQETGNVTAGSTSLLVTSPAAFESAGGWAYVGSLPIRYTGKSASAVTGVPASGAGSIPTALRYGSVIVAAPMLIGIPSSSTGSVLYSIPQGEPVNVVATANDAAAQAVMAGLVGGDGVHEEYLQDQRLSLVEAQARADARLAEVKDPLVTVRYATRDAATKAGKTVTFDLDSPITLSGVFRIQAVSIRLFATNEPGEVWPTWQVDASSRRHSFEQLLRLLKSDAA